MTSRIAAAIPAYQAAASVGAVVRGVLGELPEVLVVDDGSGDGTAEEARRAGARVISFSRNRGKGAALAAAFQDLFGRGWEGVITLDADGQHLPAEIPKLLAAAAQADLVLGIRDHLFAEMSPVRRASNRLSSKAISFAAGQRLTDVDNVRVLHVHLNQAHPMRLRRPIGDSFAGNHYAVIEAGRIDGGRSDAATRGGSAKDQGVDPVEYEHLQQISPRKGTGR